MKVCRRGARWRSIGSCTVSSSGRYAMIVTILFVFGKTLFNYLLISVLILSYMVPSWACNRWDIYCTYFAVKSPLNQEAHYFSC
jgi:hypothetical protein